MKLELTDFTAITRGSDRYRTHITVDVGWTGEGFERLHWLTFGEATVRGLEGQSGVPRHWIAAFVRDGATDGEHSSAYAIRIPLIAMHFEHVYHSCTRLSAVIDPNCGDEFHVPPADYDPFKDAVLCDNENCHPHPLVEYIPEHDPELYELVRGKQVSIWIGEKREDDDAH